MTEITHVLLTASTEHEADQVVRAYAVDAIERLPQHDACEGVSFAFDDHPQTGESSVVALVLHGNADQIVEIERDRWDSLVECGRIESWVQVAVIDLDEARDEMGTEYVELSTTVSQLSAKMSKHIYETFETHLNAVETLQETDGDLPPIGWWSVLHHLTNQQHYSLEEELLAYEYGIEHTLRNIAEYEGPNEAEERLQDHISTLGAKQAEIRDGRLD